MKLCFYLWNKSSCSLGARKCLGLSTSLPLLLWWFRGKFAVTGYCTFRFVTGCKHLTHHGALFWKSHWLSLIVCKNTHRMSLIYKALLGLVPAPLSSYLPKPEAIIALHSCVVLQLSVPRIGKKSLWFRCPLLYGTHFKTTGNTLIFHLKWQTVRDHWTMPAFLNCDNLHYQFCKNLLSVFFNQLSISCSSAFMLFMLLPSWPGLPDKRDQDLSG